MRILGQRWLGEVDRQAVTPDGKTLIWIVLATSLIAAVRGAAPPAPSLPDLVHQLDSPHFTWREASRALEAIGEPALGLLQKIAGSSADLGVRRAERIVQTIGHPLPPGMGCGTRQTSDPCLHLPDHAMRGA
jgi:hypothetical protein